MSATNIRTGGSSPASDTRQLGDSPDLSEFASLKQTQGAKCTFRPSLAGLDDADRSTLDAALMATLDIQTTAIVRWLERRKIVAAKTTVARHRPRNGDPIECVTCRT